MACNYHWCYRQVSLVGRYCVRPQGAWGSIPQYCRSIFCIMACLPGLTWPGQKVPRGDIISNPESLDSLPKADWWCHPNVTQRWCHRWYCTFSGWISQSPGIAGLIFKEKSLRIIQYTINQMMGVGLSADMSTSSDSVLNRYRFFSHQIHTTLYFMKEMEQHLPIIIPKVMTLYVFPIVMQDDCTIRHSTILLYPICSGNEKCFG